MGGGASKSAVAYIAEGKTHQEICRCLLPVYYTDAPATDDDVSHCKKSWEMITHNTAPGYLEAKSKMATTMEGKGGDDGEDGEDEHVPDTALVMFMKTFYARLFDVHPECEDMFTTESQKQGKFLVNMIALSLSLNKNQEMFKETMIGLAEAHNRRGVKAVEYGVVGDVLFWSLRTLLGSAYTNKIHNGWTRIFSAMLAIIVPVAVAFELESYKQQGLAGGPLNSIGGVGGGKKDPNLRSASEPPTGYHKPLMRQQTAHFKTKLSVQEALYLRNVQKSYHSISSNSRTTSEAGTETQHSQASTKEEA